MSKNVTRKAWDKIGKNYSQIIAPIRPTLGDCQVYGEMIATCLKGKKQPQIMVMGSTPELRRVLYTYEYLAGAEVFCFDMHENMYRAMSGFVIKGRHFNERYVRRSWLDTKMKSESLDLVVGDEVICNVPSKNHEELFREISRILKKDGVWITRHNYFLRADREAKVQEILERIAAEVSRGSMDVQYAINLLCAKILYYCGYAAHFNNSLVEHARICENAYRKHFKNHPLRKVVRELIDLYRLNWADLSGDYKWYVLSEKKSEEELRRYFAIKKKKYAADYPTVKNSPFYQLSKKVLK